MLAKTVPPHLDHQNGIFVKFSDGNRCLRAIPDVEPFFVFSTDENSPRDGDVHTRSKGAPDRETGRRKNKSIGIEAQRAVDDEQYVDAQG